MTHPLSEAGTSVEVKRLIEWLRERAGPDSGIDFEAGGYRAGHVRSDRCTVFGSDAQFVLKNFHGKGAKALADALSALIQPTPAETEDGKAGDRGDDAMDAAEMIAWFRANGWMVAVHNDYRQHGRLNTFWLLTHPNGRWVKGEGVSDALALYSAMGAARHD